MIAKCIKFHEFGTPNEVLKVEEKIVHPPLEGEVLVRMRMCPINPSDLIPIKGAYSHRISLPGIPGYEGVGIVEEVGSAVSKELIGRRVLPLRGEGTWQEFVKTAAELAVLVPNSIDDYTAAQLYINPLTAWIICTEELKLKPGDTLLVNTCGSAIGRIFAQLARTLGFRLIAVTRNNTYTKELMELGATHVINTAGFSLQDTVMELTNGRGVDAAIDSIGGPAGAALVFCIRPNGVLLTIGLLSGIPVNWPEVTNKVNIQVKLFHLRHWNQRVSIQTWQETFNHLIELIEQNRLKFMISELQFNLLEIQKAVHVAESLKSNKGKVFLTLFSKDLNPC
ncbi:zinc-dependent alcohol dehydrogenase family protein [Sporosarcina limicola]|uniref:zinc-dependent alcohol dehydrogenase family protein n=1 Tax=Sporosarcina limicola TaxID=34101 RepID=UPI00178912D6|nr:zinc-dependent alcohol dehydrogenase family protein [Sporosarcina limicola]